MLRLGYDHLDGCANYAASSRLETDLPTVADRLHQDVPSPPELCRSPLAGARRDVEAAVSGGRSLVKLSARNQLRGRVTAVKSGTVMAEVEVQVEAGPMVAAITDASRANLDLKEGDEVTVVIKATEVLIAK